MCERCDVPGCDMLGTEKRRIRRHAERGHVDAVFCPSHAASADYHKGIGNEIEMTGMGLIVDHDGRVPSDFAKAALAAY